MALKQVTLWSWLTKSETKREFFCPPGLEVTNEELAEELRARLQVNRLPAEVELCEVNWDDTGTKQIRAMVRYVGTDAKADVLRFLIGTDQMGNFAYVEQKSLLRPPDSLIPITDDNSMSASRTPLDDANGLFDLITLGVATFALERQQTKRKKAEAARQKKAWDEAWDTWRKQTLEVAYLSKTDDVFGRFTMALTSTVDDVLKRLFIDQQAELRRQAESQQTQEEIEKELEKRRAEAFK